MVMDTEVMLVEKEHKNYRRHDNHSVFRFLAVVIVCLWSVGFIFAQNYLVHQYSERDGLPSSQVFDMLQDQEGKIWFATPLGIASFDGVLWHQYGLSDGLPVLTFFRLDLDQKGRVWALSDTAGGFFYVCYLENSRWQTITNIRGMNTHVSAATTFRLLDQGKSPYPTLAIGTEADGLFLWKGSQWQQIPLANGSTQYQVNSIEVFANQLYIATDHGLFPVLLNEKGSAHIESQWQEQHKNHFPLLAGPIKGMCIETGKKFNDAYYQGDRIWFYNGNEVGWWNEQNQHSTIYPMPLHFRDPSRLVKLLPDYRGGLYLSNIYEVFYFNARTHEWQIINSTNGLISDGANAMMIDYEKNIWLSCYRGVSCISSRRFSNFRSWNGLMEDEVTAILEYQPGHFILGHNNSITFMDKVKIKSETRFQSFPFFAPGDSQIPLCRVLDIKADSQQNIWMACSRVGLAKIDRQRQLTWYRKEYGLPENIICLWIDPQDKVLVGTEKGIYQGGEKGFVPYPVAPLNTLNARRLYGKNGQLHYLAGNSDGLYIYREKKKYWQHYQISGNEHANAVYSIKESKDGRLWIGTKAGLFIMETTQTDYHRFQYQGFTIERPVYSILEDALGRLWFGTDNGLICWNGHQARTYTPTEGLTGNESNRAAAIMDSHGKLWFGTNRGLSIYDDQFDDHLTSPPPKVRLLSLSVNGHFFSLQKPLELKNKQNTLTFYFRCTSFMDPSAIRFKTRLEGLEQKWSAEKGPYSQLASYPELTPGTYRFHVKAKNALGIWSDEIHSATIVILKPFYRQWWFYLLLSLAFVVVIYSILRFFNQRRYASQLEKKVAEHDQQLQAASEQYRHLFEESGDGVFINTREGKFIDINPAGVKLFGYDSKDELLALDSIQNLYETPGERQKYREKIETNGFVKDYEIIFRRKDGQLITTRVTATLVRNAAGDITAYRGIIRDITTQKELEQKLMQAQKMEAIGTLAGGIAHDFNNILGVIVGFSELALEDVEEGSLIHQNIRNVLTAAERASELVKQILAFSRQSERKRIPIILSQTIRESLKLLRSSLPTTIAINQDIQANDARILGDATQMHQIMMNLCANAGFAMKKTGGILEVSLNEVQLDQDNVDRYCGLKPGPYLRLTVSDTGCGIPAHVIKRIFDPYFTTKQAGEGTGMGLAVIHGIIKSHGGDITVYSEVNKGTTFNVWLPCFEGETENKTEVYEEAQTGTERILFVDDEEALTRVGSQVLRRLGYSVTGISNPVEALALFTQSPQDFDLVITDLTMPHMTGIQLSRAVKNIKPGIPVILCSGFSTIDTRKKFKAYGVNEFVMKPVVRNDLAKAVRKVLDNQDEKPNT